MKTLADFKRAMFVGSVWYRKHYQINEFEKRTVVKSDTTGVWVEDENGKRAKLDFPKASEFEINQNGEAEIYWSACEVYEKPRRLILTYKKA